MDKNDALLQRAYSVDIKGHKIFHVQYISKHSKKSRSYFFMRYSLNKNQELTMEMLNGKYPPLKNKKFKTSLEFRKFMEANIDKPGLFMTPIKFKKSSDIKLVLTQPGEGAKRK